MDVTDRVFWGLIGFIAIHFILLAGLERYVNFYLGSAVGFGFLVWFVLRGYKIFDRGRSRK